MTEERLDLLDVLDGLVNRDGAATGLTGEICVGLKKPEGFRWWRACFRPRFYTAFVEAPSASAHATLFIDHDTAEAVLGTGRLPDAPQLLMVEGDRALMMQFLQRYTSRTNWLGAQFQRVQAARAVTGKRRRRGGF